MVVGAPGVGFFRGVNVNAAMPYVPVRSRDYGPCMRLAEPLFRCQLRQLSRRLESKVL
jgi:hypothetical protein